MTTVRGLSINSTPISITEASYQVNRNLIVEEDAVSVAGDAIIYGGYYTVNGSFSAAYRPQTINPFIEQGILGKTGGGVSETFTKYDVTLGDHNDKAWTFGSCALTSCDISLQSGQFSKCNFEWVGTYKKPANTIIGAADYTKEPTLFYNAMISNGIKCRSLTFRIDRPIAAEDYILGSEYTQTLIQSSNLTVGGSMTLSNKDYSMMDEVLYTTDEANWNNDDPKDNVTLIGDLTVKFRNPSGSVDLCTIYLDEIHIQDLNVSVNGQKQYEKTVEWRATTSPNDGITFTTAT